MSCRALLTSLLPCLLAFAAPAYAAAGAGHAAKLGQLYARYREDNLRLHPLAAMQIGDNGYNDQLPISLSAAHRAQELRLARRYIRALRERAEHALGDRFDVRACQTEVLKDGSLPLEILAAKIDRWIAARKAAS